METLSPLSAELTAVADLLAENMHGTKPLPLAKLYARLIRARDEAVCLEARASARDVSVHRLLDDITGQCTELARLARLPGVAAAAARLGDGQ